MITLWNTETKSVLSTASNKSEAVGILCGIDCTNILIIDNGNLIGSGKDWVKTSECPECGYPNQAENGTCNLSCVKCGARFQ